MLTIRTYVTAWLVALPLSGLFSIAIVHGKARRGVCIVLFFLGSLGRLPAIGQETPLSLPQEVPFVIFDGPVNATWAANHAAYWKNLGIDGFLFYGLIDALDSPSRAETDAGEETPLTREIRVACQRLREAGINRHFLHLSLSPEDRWYTDRNLAREAITRFEQAGILGRRAELRGLALDINRASLLHDLRWDGYDLAQTPAESIRQGARDLARRALRAYIREHPDGEVLIIADRLDEAGPLCFDFVEGLIEAVGAAESIHLSLVLRETVSIPNPVFLDAHLQRMNRLLQLRLSPSASAQWRKQGGFTLCLRPADIREDGQVLLTTPENYRVQISAAKTWSSRYCIIEAPRGGWWSVLPEEAEAYAASNQTGKGAVQPMTAVFEDPALFQTSTPLDSLQRIGPLPFQDGLADVFRSKTGAVALPWAGLPNGFSITGRNAPLPVTDLRTGETRSFTPLDGAVHVPPYGGPVLLANLPVGEWAVAAGMWLLFDAPLSADARRVRASFGCLNATDILLEGRLEALPPEGYSMGRAAFPLKLPPGERSIFQRTVQGILFAGEAAEFGLGLTLSGGGQIRRTFAFRVQPKMLWEAQRDGALTGPPVLFDLNGDNRPEVLVTGRWGEIACYDGVSGTLLWERRFQAAFDLPPAAGYGIDGEIRIIAVDHRGLLRFFNPQGEILREVDVGGPCVKNGLLVWPGVLSDTIIAGKREGRIQTYTFSGNLLWDLDLQGPLTFLTNPVAIPGEWNDKTDLPPPPIVMLFAVSGGDSPTLTAVSDEGAPLWRQGLNALPTTSPVLFFSPKTETFQVIQGLFDGTVVAYNVLTGEEMVSPAPETKRPITALAAGILDPASGPQILVADALGVACYANDARLLWQTPLPHPNAMTLFESDTGACVLVSTDTGALYNLDKHGDIHWRDLRPAAPLSGAAQIALIDKDLAPDAAYTAADGRLRVIRFDPPVPLPGLAEAPLMPQEPLSEP